MFGEREMPLVVIIDSLERLTGIDFFPGMNNELETKIEQTADFTAWKTQGKSVDVEPLNALE